MTLSETEARIIQNGLQSSADVVAALRERVERLEAEVARLTAATAQAQTQVAVMVARAGG